MNPETTYPRGWSFYARAAALMLVCVLVNLAGKQFAAAYELPLWLDAFGTALAAYALGPICGALVGAAVNVLANLAQPLYMVYALTSAAIGLIIGLCAKKRMLESLFGTLTTGFLVTITSVAISTPLNRLFFDGYTGNKWGDGVIGLMLEKDCPALLCHTVGEYYVDFLDKVLTLLVLCGCIRLARRFRGRRGGPLAGAAILILVLAVSAAPASAAGEGDYNNYLQTIYNSNTGLPGGVANDVAQTEDGVLWVGTYGGLYRYTGRQFQLMKQFESIKNVNALYVDKAERLWIGTNDSGLSVCDGEEILHVLDEEQGLPSNSVRCVTMDAQGRYFVGTTDALAVVGLSDELTVIGTVPQAGYAWSLSADGEGRTAAVTKDGGLFLLRGTEVLTRARCEEPGETFACCLFDADGTLWVGSSGGKIFTYRLEGDGLKNTGVISCPGVSGVNELKRGDRGELLVCADNAIGWLDGEGTYHPVTAPQFSNSVGHVLTDYQGDLWFTSSRLGLLKLCASPFTEIFSRVGLEAQVVNTITQWRGNFYFGTDSGLDAADGHLARVVRNDLTAALEGVRIRCLMTDSAGELWICTSGRGVWRASSERAFTVYDSAGGTLGDWFRSALELSDGTVAVAGDSGITFFRDGTVVGTLGSQDGLDNPRVLCMLELDDGTLLAGTDGNGIALIRDGRVAQTLKKEAGLSSKVILRMVKDPEGVFLVTSNSLNFMDREYGIRVLGDFPYYNNFDITPGPAGELFVSSSAGLYVVDRSALLSGGDVDCKLLDNEHGLRTALTANAWNYVDEAGCLYLAGDTGVTMLDLGHYDFSHQSYRMNLRALLADDVDCTPARGERASIPRSARRVVFLPEIMNYSIGDPNVRFFLEGFDAAPQVVSMSDVGEIAYTNLAPGSYTFCVDILDDRGEAIASQAYPLTVEKEMYDEGWFLFYVGFVFLLTVVYLTWMIFRTQIQRTLELQKRELEVARKQVEMSNEAILTIARAVDAKDIHTSEHSFRVAQYAVMIAKRLGFSSDACDELQRAALLHDIGKIGIPDSILNKPGKLTDEEYTVMKSHVVQGAKILKDFTSVDHIVEGAQFHHERYDGTGYAQGLKGEDIPLYARIIGIADAFDAMTANRVYRKQMDLDYVLSELTRCSGTQFDPKLVEILLSLIDDGTIDVEGLYAESRAPAGPDAE